MSDERAHLIVWRWNASEGRHTRPVEVSTSRRVFTVRDLQTAVNQLVNIDPRYADLPVSLLDMRKDDDDESIESSLLTDVETDVFDDDQGLVLSLTSWPLRSMLPGEGSSDG